MRQLLDPLVRADRGALFRGGAVHARPLFGDALPSADADYATLYGLYWLLVELTERRPALIVIDDIHWADAPSLRFLAFLARRLDGIRLLVTGALRPAEPGTDRSLLSEFTLGAEVVRPAPLRRCWPRPRARASHPPRRGRSASATSAPRASRTGSCDGSRRSAPARPSSPARSRSSATARPCTSPAASRASTPGMSLPPPPRCRARS